jgi:DNA-binding response OmpR family regulator
VGSKLVVDDERIIRITLKPFLSEDGYDIQVVEDANQVIELFRETDFYVDILRR